MRALVLVGPLLLAACTEGEPIGLSVLGNGSHTPDAVTLTVLATDADGLNAPTDVAVNPRNPSQLWVTNMADNSIVRVTDGVAEHFYSMGSDHFLASPSSLAFSDFGNFATAQDTDEVTQSMTPADFMGPTLWDDSDMFDAGHSGHLDMLHNSPNGGGIAWESANVYWVVDGANESLTRYDFGLDHGYGGSDHSDGIIHRYAEGLIHHDKGTPNHVDMLDGVLYVANGAAISRFDPNTATRSGSIGPNYDGAEMAGFAGGNTETFAHGALDPVLDEDGVPTVDSLALTQPSGLEIHDGLMWVTDRATGIVFALTLDGELVDWLPTGRPDALGGLDIDPVTGDVYVVDQVAHELIRIAAQ
ncbi:MAG: hypothetical protein EP330_17915 [Deltaproteobacteria bacterium]|nr:MAG: hypothetical protein EP330_17915 [Deltaproteobacteria bacterium]